MRGGREKDSQKVQTKKQKRHRYIEQSYGLCGRGRGGMIWENGIKTCIILYKRQIASPGSMHDTGCLGLVHWDNSEGWYEEGGGRGVQDGEPCTPVADSC